MKSQCLGASVSFLRFSSPAKRIFPTLPKLGRDRRAAGPAIRNRCVTLFV